METEEILGYEYEEITDTDIVLRERRAGYSTHGYDFEDATGAIIGCALEVHRILGPGFREIVYQRALANYVKASGSHRASRALPISPRAGLHVENCFASVRRLENKMALSVSCFNW